jgi:cob(I)alamin adenosyltransferase
MRIYTRTGDDGFTSTLSGERVPKDNVKLKAIGDLDELNSHLGTLETHCQNKIQYIQTCIFDISAYLGNENYEFDLQNTDLIEEWIDAYEQQLEPLSKFILPSGAIHVARAVCRRAERSVVECGVDSCAVLSFINRIGDFLFTLARIENKLKDTHEVEYKFNAHENFKI